MHYGVPKRQKCNELVQQRTNESKISKINDIFIGERSVIAQPFPMTVKVCPDREKLTIYLSESSSTPTGGNLNINEEINCTYIFGYISGSVSRPEHREVVRLSEQPNGQLDR